MVCLPCDIKILLTVFNESYNCQTSHYLGRNQLPKPLLMLPSLFATEIKLCSVHIDPREWKIEPNISLNHTANMCIQCQRYFHSLFLKEEVLSFNRWANVTFKVFLCYWDQTYTLIQNMVILLWSFKFRDMILVILWPKNECFTCQSLRSYRFEQSCRKIFEDLWKCFLKTVWKFRLLSHHYE